MYVSNSLIWPIFGRLADMPPPPPDCIFSLTNYNVLSTPELLHIIFRLEFAFRLKIQAVCSGFKI